MQPQPLVRIFTHPAFDHIGDRLHRALDIDLSGSVDFGSGDVTKLAVSTAFVATLALTPVFAWLVSRWA